MPHRRPPPRDVEATLERFETALKPYERRRAAGRLSRAPPAALRRIVSDLRTAVVQYAARGDARRLVTRDLLTAIARAGGNGALAAITEVYELATDAADHEARRAAVTALEELDDERALPLVRTAVDDPDAGVRSAAVRTLGSLAAGTSEQATVRDRLESLLLDDDEGDTVRRAAAVGLGSLGDTDVRPALWRVARDDRTMGWVREAGVESIGRLGDDADVDPLFELALARLERERYADHLGKTAALALGDVGTSAAVDALVELVRTEIERGKRRGHVVDGAASALGEIGDERAVPLLEELRSTTAHASLAAVRFRIEPETAFEYLGTYDLARQRAYDNRLSDLLADRALETGALDLAWEFLPSAQPRGRTRLVRRVLANHGSFDEAATDALALWVLESPVQRRVERARQVEALLDPPGRAVLDRLVETRRERTREAAMGLFEAFGDRSMRVSLDLLGAFSGDAVVADRLREVVRTETGDRAAMVLRTLHEVLPDTARSTAWTVLRENPGGELETAALDVLRAADDGDLDATLVARFTDATDPDRVGRLSERLLLVAGLDPTAVSATGDPTVAGETLYSLLASKVEDEAFYERLAATYGGYDVNQPTLANEDPRRLPAVLFGLDRVRAGSDLRELVRTADSPGLRADALRILRTFSEDDPDLLAERLADPNPSVRYVAANALAADGHERAVPLLGSVARDPAATTPKRRAAIRLLADSKTDASVDELIRIVQPDREPVGDDAQSVRATAVNSLGSVDDERATTFLRGLAGRDDGLAIAARNALE